MYDCVSLFVCCCKGSKFLKLGIWFDIVWSFWVKMVFRDIIFILLLFRFVFSVVYFKGINEIIVFFD